MAVNFLGIIGIGSALVIVIIVGVVLAINNR
jgi:hypothetical protein